LRINTGAVAGFVTLTLGVPVIVADTVPETVVEPVTCRGTDFTTLTAKPSGGPWAAARSEFIIVPMVASRVNTAAAMNWFLKRFIFDLLFPDNGILITTRIQQQLDLFKGSKL
jgi:hypothetical protein